MSQASPESRPPLKVIVASNLFRLRKAKTPQWSQEKLARESGLSKDTIYVLETGRDPLREPNAPQLDTIEAIAKALSVHPDELLRWDPETMRVYLHARALRSRLSAVPSGSVLDHAGNLLAPLPGLAE